MKGVNEHVSALTRETKLALSISKECIAEDRVIIVIGEERLIKRFAMHSMGDKLAIVLPTYSLQRCQRGAVRKIGLGPAHLKVMIYAVYEENSSSFVSIPGRR